jgi:nitroimidazol reductase NimA-like FMN-containing flavoprotein (pyridoxamine 5'-phosphate oxidase superfamily)
MAAASATRVTRHPERQRHEIADLHAILDAGTVAHLGLCRDDGPVVLPLLYARDGNRLLLHGSTGAGVLRLAAQMPVVVEVTLLDGLVFAGTVFNLSANCRSAVIFGRCSILEGAEKMRALRLLVDRLMPGRWDELGSPSAKEVAATAVLALPLDQTSVKVRSGPPLDDPAPEVWRGVLPVSTAAEAAVPAPGSQDLPVPASLTAAAARIRAAVSG